MDEEDNEDELPTSSDSEEEEVDLSWFDHVILHF